MFSYKYRFFEPYYLINYAVILSYFLVRRYYLDRSSILTSKASSWFGLTREVEIFLLAVIIQLKSIRKSFNIDRFIDSLILSLKTVIIVLSYQLNTSLCIIYCVIFFVLYCTLSPPSFHGESKVIDYSEMTFKSLVLDDHTKTKYLVMFDTKWATGIDYVKAIFASLSNKYSSDSLVFLHIDLTNRDSFAKELQINIDGYAGEIPVFIEFQKGKEITRLPQKSNKPHFSSYRWSEDVLCTAFSLDEENKKKKE